MENIKKILLPLDGSALGDSAISSASSLARSHSAEIILFGCVNLNDLTGAAVDMNPGNFMALFDEATSQAKSHLKTVCDELQNQGITVSSRLSTGHPVESIVQQASEDGVDLIVMASHGRSGLKRLLLGSVTEGVLRRADRPVLVIPAKRSA